jgi:hypothetical protein
MSSGIMSKQQIRSGERVVLFLLLPSNKQSYYINQAKCNLISNEGSEVLFQVAGLPIVGTYDEYDYLVNIEKTEFVKQLESHLDVSIEDFVKYLRSDHNKLESEKAIEIANQLSSCMEHYSIYKQMVQIDREKRTYKNSDLYYTVLERLGFKLVEKLNKKRYSLKYEHVEFPSVEIYSDGHFVEVFNNKKEVGGIYNLKDLLSFVELDFDESLSEIDLFFEWAKDFTKDTVFKVYSEEDKKEKEKLYDEFLEIDSNDREKLSELLNKLKEIEKRCDMGLTKEDEEKNTQKLNLLISLGSSKFKKLTGKSTFDFDNKELAELSCFKYSMWSTSSLFMPTYSSYNDTEPDYEEELLDTINQFRKYNRN